MVLTMPAVPKGRYYVMQLIDLFTFNFAYVGVRAADYEAGRHLIDGPGWKGDTPVSVTKVFTSESDIVEIFGRT